MNDYDLAVFDEYSRARAVAKRRKKEGTRGFSRGELKKVGLSPKQAFYLGIPADARR